MKGDEIDKNVRIGGNLDNIEQNWIKSEGPPARSWDPEGPLNF